MLCHQELQWNCPSVCTLCTHCIHIQYNILPSHSNILSTELCACMCTYILLEELITSFLILSSSAMPVCVGVFIHSALFLGTPPSSSRVYISFWVTSFLTPFQQCTSSYDAAIACVCACVCTQCANFYRGALTSAHACSPYLRTYMCDSAYCFTPFSSCPLRCL